MYPVVVLCVEAEELASWGGRKGRKGRESESEKKGREESLLLSWVRLLEGSRAQSRALDEARDLLNFNQLEQRLLHWIKDKVNYYQYSFIHSLTENLVIV